MQSVHIMNTDQDILSLRELTNCTHNIQNTQWLTCPSHIMTNTDAHTSLSAIAFCTKHYLLKVHKEHLITYTTMLQRGIV